jgi:hypothetical protein
VLAAEHLSKQSPYTLEEAKQQVLWLKQNSMTKKQETAELIQYINSNHLWVCDINFDLFISEGAEQKIYVKGEQKVLKLNDSI